MASTIEILCCYAREDKDLFDELKKHLSPLLRQDVIHVWHDGDISAGTKWEEEIKKHLNDAEIILLLISADFIKSDYCYSTEMMRAMKRHESGEARVIPIILRPVDWKSAPFAKLQVLPSGARPITRWEDLDDAFLDVVQEIRSVCEKLLSLPLPPKSKAPKIGIDKVKDGKIVRAENIVFPDSSRHILTEKLGDLQPTFNNLITDWTQDFVGRKSIFNQLDKFLREETSGYFIIEGDPGIGKTALIAQLVKERGYLHHFNMQGITEISLFLESICKQLISLFQLDYVPVPKKPYENNKLFNSLLKEASGKLKADERLVLAIDALDEADRPLPDQNELYLPPALPRGIFIVVTSRHKHYIRLVVSRWGGQILRNDSQDNTEDVREYIKFYIDKYNIQQQVQSFNMAPEDFIETMLTKSEGNFMYLHYVLPDIKDGKFLLGTLEELPQGLEAYYRFHWEKMRNHDPQLFETLYKPVLCILANEEEAISIDQIAAYAGVKEDKVIEVIREWEEFLHKIKIMYQPPSGRAPSTSEQAQIKDELRFDSTNIRQLRESYQYQIYHLTFSEFLGKEIDPELTATKKLIRTYLRRKSRAEDENTL